MATYTFTSNASSVLLDVDGKQAPFGDKELHPYTPDRAGNTLYLYDSTGILKKIGVSGTHQENNRSKDRIPIDLSIDTVDVDGTASWANSGVLLDALRAIFFLASGGGSGQGWDGVVANRNALPITDPPAVGSVYLAENPVLIAGIYKQYTSGLYIRQTSTGALSDWRKLNTKSRFTTSEFRVLDAADQTKQIAIANAGQTTGTTRTWTAPDKDIRLINKTDLGWIQFQDTTYDSVSPLAILTGVRTVLPNDAGNVLDVVSMVGAAALWDNSTNTFEPDNSGDLYDFRLQFTVDPAVNNRNLQIELDIGGAVGVIWDKTIRLARGAGVNTRVTETMQLYTLATFIANGGQIFVTCDGDIDVYDIVFVIERKYRND